MEHTRQLTTGGPFGRPAHPATTALLAASAVLLHLAARLEHRLKRSAAEQPQREVAVQELNGVAGGAVFEDGKLVGWIPGITRL